MKIVWVNLLVGIWLLVAPFAVAANAMSSARTVNDIILGVLLIAFSWWMLAAIAPPTGTAWFEMLCGIWLIVAPFVLGYARGAAAAMWNDVVCGIIALVVGTVAARATTRATVA